MSNSIFDLLGENQGPQGGLSGLAVALQQGQQSQGLRQGLGAGLLNLSGFAEQALPSAIQGGFGPAALTGFLSSVGAPARQAAAKEEERGKMKQAVQLDFLKAVFPKLSSAGKTEVLKRIGINLPLGEEPAEPSQAYKDMLAGLRTVFADNNEDPKTRKDAFDFIKSVAPELADASPGISFFAPNSEDKINGKLLEVATDQSWINFHDPNNPAYHRWDMVKIDPSKAKTTGGKTSQSELLQMQAIEDYGQIQKLMAEQGLDVQAATDQYFINVGGGAEDKARRSNFEKTYGQTAGPAPLSEYENILKVGQSLVNSSILENLNQVMPETEKFLNQAGALAEKRAAAMGTTAFPQGKVGARNPAYQPKTGVVTGGTSTAAPVGPVAPPKAQPKPVAATTPASLTEGLLPNQAVEADAMYRAAQELGVDLAGATSWPLLKAKLQTLPPDQIQKIKARGQALIKQDENTEATD